MLCGVCLHLCLGSGRTVLHAFIHVICRMFVCACHVCMFSFLALLYSFVLFCARKGLCFLVDHFVTCEGVPPRGCQLLLAL